MAEYINRNELVENLEKFAPEHLTPLIRTLIEKQPTADVVEVKHGHWITDENGIVICSECGEEHAWDEYRATYCEDCGAKMDGGS